MNARCPTSLATALALALCACPGPEGVDSDPGLDSPGETAADSGPADTGEPEDVVHVFPDDPGLRYVGRWSFDDPVAPSVGWQGASVALRFVGTDLSVTMDAGRRDEAFRVIVDGDHLGSRRFMASGQGRWPLVQGLEAGEHSVELVKETYVGSDLVLQGLELTGAGLLDSPDHALRRLEFYGDSNLAGSSLMSERNQGGAERDGSHFTYAGITARAFDADYHNISVSGETLRGMTELYDRQSWYDGVPTWDHAVHPADVVVMNLGANDINGADEATIRQRYVTMLDLLRAAQPEAHIVVYNGWGWDYDEPADYTAEVVDAYGDPDVSVAVFPWVFEQWHGCEYDHGGMARHLIRHLEEVTGWTAHEPALMSGFGEDGGLANGGFEELAPFGGFGWRYFDDVGVERVVDATQAHSGEAYLRLEGGAQVHQPNPAQPGQTVTVQLWLRGDHDGDSAELTLDFRDQNMWTTPLASESTTLELSTEWTLHELSATAPSGGERPVFHTRLTVAAGADSAISVDGIGMRTE